MARVVGSCRGRPGDDDDDNHDNDNDNDDDDDDNDNYCDIDDDDDVSTMQKRLGTRGAADSLEKMRSTEDLVTGHLWFIIVLIVLYNCTMMMLMILEKMRR